MHLVHERVRDEVGRRFDYNVSRRWAMRKTLFEKINDYHKKF
jgi:hypothetical protein